MLSRTGRNTRYIINQIINRNISNETNPLKVAIVTGSSSGIGLGIAQRLAINDGYSVMINGRRPETKDIANTIQDQLPSNTKQRILYHQADMSSYEQIQDLIDFTMKSFGKLDVLVNNAGMQYVASIQEYPIEKYQQLIDVNLSATFYAIKECLPYMIENGHGRIINISSQLGLFAQQFKSAYCAAKHGVVGLTKEVALEIAKQNITCNAICPGYVDTALVRNQMKKLAELKGLTEQEAMEQILINQPTGRLVEISEIAAVVSFLCSDDAKSINGASIPIEGGALAQ